jgi:hypothetical protein
MSTNSERGPETVIACHRRGFRLFWTWKADAAPAVRVY